MNDATNKQCEPCAHDEECICKDCVEECIGELLMGLSERHK